MSGGQEKSRLRAELESFARIARGFTTAHLQEFQGVLKALFGEEALVDAVQRQVIADSVERALLGMIADIRDPKDRRIAQAVFAATPEFYGLRTVSERVGLIQSVDSHLYYARRRIILGDATAALQVMFGEQKAADHGALLSPQARRAARQLYRYAQSTLVCVDAYDLCATYARELEVSLHHALSSREDLDQISHGWLQTYSFRQRLLSQPEEQRNRPWLVLYGEDDVDVHLAPAFRTSVSDSGLWNFAYTRRYLGALLHEYSGREFLRENFAANGWQRMQLGAPFEPLEVDKMLSVLSELRLDYAQAYIEDLCQDAEGRTIHTKWLDFLSAPRSTAYYRRGAYAELPTDEDRYKLRHDLLRLCILLQDIFPEDTLDDHYRQCWDAVLGVMLEGLEESGWHRVIDIEGQAESGLHRRIAVVKRISELHRDVMKLRATRYSGRDEGKGPWHADSSFEVVNDSEY